LIKKRNKKNQGFERKASESRRDQPKPSETRLSQFSGLGCKRLKQSLALWPARQLSECFSFGAIPNELQYFKK